MIGHRGAAAYAPENTLAALRKANAIDCRWVEFDVRLTSDGKPVLLHDDRLERTTDGSGKVSALPLETVRQYDAGSWFDAAFAQERVPTLEEAVAVVMEFGLGANVELKAARGRKALTGTIVADLLARIWPSSAPGLVISSFQGKVLAAAAAGAPKIPRGILFRAVPWNWRASAERLGCATVHADHEQLRPAIVSQIRGAGYPLLVYTVNDPERARTLFDWGVTSVFSDVPRRLRGLATRTRSFQPTTAEQVSGGIPWQGPGW